MKASDFGVLPPSCVGLWSFNRTGQDVWHREHFSTREEAVAAGREEFGPEAGFQVGRFAENEIDPPDAEDVIEHLCCRLNDRVPSDFSDGFISDVSKEVKADLTARIEKAVGDWLTEHGEWPDFATVTDITDVSPTPAAEDATAVEQP